MAQPSQDTLAFKKYLSYDNIGVATNLDCISKIYKRLINKERKNHEKDKYESNKNQPITEYHFEGNPDDMASMVVFADINIGNYMPSSTLYEPEEQGDEWILPFY